MNNNRTIEQPFWKIKALDEMSHAEWESLCDGCARCCLEKLEDADSGEVFYTSVACRFLDLERCRCKAYSRRERVAADCLLLTPESLKKIHWLPKTCAYRCLSEGKNLEWWHPLVSGDDQTIHEVGLSVKGKVVPYAHVKDSNLEPYIIEADIY